MNATPLPHVSSEGGPVLVADFEALRSWRGVESGDYDMACETLGDDTVAELPIGSHQVLVWHIGGPGTADIIIVSPEHISIVRIWPDGSGVRAGCDFGGY